MIFSKIVHWSGIVVHTIFGLSQKAETEFEADLPQLEQVLETGATICSLLPVPMSKTLESGLNLSVELLGAFDRTLHKETPEFQQLVALANQALPPDSDETALLIPKDLHEKVTAYLASIQAELNAAKQAATQITGDSGAPAAKQQS